MDQQEEIGVTDCVGRSGALRVEPAAQSQAEPPAANARTALERSFIDLLDKHNLLSVSVTAHRSDNGEFGHFNCNVQWRDEGKEHRRGCTSASSGAIGASLGEAVSNMIAERAGTAAASLADESLLTSEAA